MECNFTYTVATLGKALKDANLPGSKNYVYGLVYNHVLQEGREYVNVSQGAHKPIYRFDARAVIKTLSTPLGKR